MDRGSKYIPDGRQAFAERMISTLLSLLTLLLFLTTGCSSPDSPAKVVDNFYRIHFQAREAGATGVPDTSERAALHPLVSMAFAADMEYAARLQDSAIRYSPDEKPPWIEGDVFSSLFEGPVSYRVGTATPLGDSCMVMVYFEYRDPRGGKPTQWNDVVILKRENGWKVDDIEFRGGWDFGGRGRLRDQWTIQPRLAA